MSRPWTRIWIGVALMLATADCSLSGDSQDDLGTSPEPVTESEPVTEGAPVPPGEPERPFLTLWPSSASIPLGYGVGFFASLTRPGERPRDVTPNVTWTSSNPEVFAMDERRGPVSVAPGTATVTVSMGGLTSNSATVHVRPVEFLMVNVKPNEFVFVMVGEKHQFTATAHFTDGSTRDVTDTAIWTSANPGVATMSPGGVATATGEGDTFIRATVDGVSNIQGHLIGTPAIESISIITDSPSMAVGETYPLIAYATLTNGAIVDVTDKATWASSDPAVAVVNGQRFALGVAAGTTVITATRAGVTSRSTVLTVRD